MAIPKFSETHLRELSNVLEGAISHKELTDLFRELAFDESTTAHGTNPKWERILRTLSIRQHRDTNGNNVGTFIETVISPIRFIRKPNEFEDYRHRINLLLSFTGLSLTARGKLTLIEKAESLDEATERAGKLRKALNSRSVHPDVLRFCKAELLQENYFHAVFEATKSVADKIKEKSGLGTDGSELVDGAFSIKNPILAINSLQTESEQSEHKGFANLLKGLFGTFRNVTAHAPKIKWRIEEQDALDLLTIVSYLHRRLDKAVKVPKIPST